MAAVWGSRCCTNNLQIYQDGSITQGGESRHKRQEESSRHGVKEGKEPQDYKTCPRNATLALFQYCPHTYFKARCAFETCSLLFASTHHYWACVSVLTSKPKSKTLHISRVTLFKQQPLTPGSCYTLCSLPPIPCKARFNKPRVREGNVCTQW